MDDSTSKREHARTIFGGLFGLALVAAGIAAAFTGQGGAAFLLIAVGVGGGLAIRFMT